MKNTRGALLAALIITGAAVTSVAARAADAILSGAITSAAGEKLGGITVSAKPVGGTVTTTVFTDESGDYYFPPLPAGKYRVWAQAVSFETAKAEVDLSAARKQGFVLAPMKDFVRQLPGNVMLSALPEESEQDKRMKRIVRNNCTGCHTPSYMLQHRFDEAGWNAIIELMKNANVYGTFVGDDRKPAGILDYHQKELAAYLARARGPGEGAMKFKPDPRPSGEAARVMFKEYDVPLDADAGLPSNFVQNDGSDWSLGTPSVLIPGWGVHDAWLDLDGQLWFTCNIPEQTHHHRQDRQQDRRGEAVQGGGSQRAGGADPRHDARSERHHLVQRQYRARRPRPPRSQRPRRSTSSCRRRACRRPAAPPRSTTTARAGSGRRRRTARCASIPTTETFTEFKSITYKTPNGTGVTYGAAADRDGNGWWAEMTLDIIGKGDEATGKSQEVKLAPVKAEMDRLTPEARKFYETYNQPDFNNPLPWAQGPRRMGTDKNADVLWVGNSWGANLARIDTQTHETTYVPLPGEQQPYHVAVDKKHNAWTNLWGADRVLRYDPKTSTWTAFDLPTRGAEPRYVSLLEQEGAPMQVVLPYFRARKVAVMTLRSESDLQALKTQVGSR